MSRMTRGIVVASLLILAAIGRDNGGCFLSDDPGFTDGYHLANDSCAIDNGHDSSDLLAIDIDGESRVVGVPDLGADEVQDRQAFGLLAGALNYQGTVWTGGDADWHLYTPGSYDYARTGEIESGQETWLKAIVAGAGTISFYRYVYLPGTGDSLQFTIDGVLMDQWSGSLYGTVSYEISSAGPHTLCWNYSNSSGSSGYAYLDNLGYVPCDPYGLVEVSVGTGSNDVEENSSGTMDLSSSDLDLRYSSGERLVGLRFPGVEIPQGVTVTEAYLEITADEYDTSVCTLVMKAQASDDAETFSSSSYDLSSRSMTSASVSWSPATWAPGNVYNSPDISSVIQELVNRSGWVSGQAMVFKLEVTTGERVAKTYPNFAVLHIEYELP